MEDRSTEVEAIRVTAAETQGKSETPSGQTGVEAERPGIRPEKNANFLSGKKLKEALVFRHNTLQSGSCLDGPALILHSHSTTVIEPDWRGTLLEDGTWFLEAIHKPVPVCRRPDGRNAPEDIPLRECERTARLFLRPARPRRISGGKRPPHPRAFGCDGFLCTDADKKF